MSTAQNAPAYSITNLLHLFFSNPLNLPVPLCHFDREQTHSAKHSLSLAVFAK